MTTATFKVINPPSSSSTYVLYNTPLDGKAKDNLILRKLSDATVKTNWRAYNNNDTFKIYGYWHNGSKTNPMYYYVKTAGTSAELGNKKGKSEGFITADTAYVTATCSHTWSVWTTKTNATQTTTGLKERTCTNCGKLDKATIPATGGGTSSNGKSRTKGTQNSALWTTGYTPDLWVDYYASLGWIYPLEKTSIVTVSAMLRDGYYYDQYHKANDPNSGKHWGVDLAAGLGEVLVTPFDGEVQFAGVVTGGGYSIALKSKSKDPVNGEFLIMTYHHMRYASPLEQGDKVFIKDKNRSNKPTLAGYVGNTSGIAGLTYGYHLHYQITSTGKYYHDRDWSKTINPVYFYPNTKFIYNYNNDGSKMTPKATISG